MLSLLVLASICMVAYGENSCEDILPNCQNLADVYCKAPFDKLAADVCAKRCELCPEGSDRIEKRAHGLQPSWLDHCWDTGENHLRDPFCSLLTTPVPTTPTTQSTTIPTTPRTCYYIEYNETDIKATDYANELLPNNATLNESVHLFGDSSYCKTVCEQSLLNDGYECWGFTYSPTERCHLYYYDKPIYIIQFSLTGESNNTSLFLKRCNNDPSTPFPETTTTAAITTTTIATTTQRYCDYEIYNSTSITATDFGLVTQVVNGQNVTVNETVRVAKEEAECKTICEASILNDGYECWGFSFNSVVKCYLYYYSRPITIIDIPMIGNKTDTTLYLKRCSDDRVRFGGTTLSTSGTLPPGVLPGVPNTHSPPSFNNEPDGIKVVNGSSFTITGTPTNGSVCFFNNHSYVLGDTWADGCQFQCQCTNTTSNIASCTDRCPHYTNYPSSCSLINTNPADCCYTLNCTDMNNTTNGNCTNKIDTCDYYAKSACSGIYQPWAKANCELRCNLCDDGTKEPCYDAYSFCERFGPTLCTDYAGYARQNCRKFCNLCDS